LPNGIFTYIPKIQVWYLFEGLGMENLGIYYSTYGEFCEHLVYFVVTGYISSHFGMLYQEKSGNPVADLK
jgi:hypothetical protein